MAAENLDPYIPPENDGSDAGFAADHYDYDGDIHDPTEDGGMLNTESVDCGDTAADDIDTEGEFITIVGDQFAQVRDVLSAELQHDDEATPETCRDVWSTGVALAKEGEQIPPDSPLPGGGIYMEDRGYVPPLGEHEYDSPDNGPDWTGTMPAWREKHISITYEPAALGGGNEKLGVVVSTASPQSGINREQTTYRLDRAPDNTMDIQKFQSTNADALGDDAGEPAPQELSEEQPPAVYYGDVEAALESLQGALDRRAEAEAWACEIKLTAVSETEAAQLLRMLTLAYKR